MKLIVGLGNPGKEYENTRHNVGFMMIDYYVQEKGLDSYKEKFKGLYTEFNYNGEKVVLLKPEKYMNLSGEVIRKYLDFYKIKAEDLLIISDDKDLLVGNIKLKESGSSGGHNGLKNIEDNINTSEYKRLKIGIGRSNNLKLRDYVLKKISKADLEKINKLKPLVLNIIDDYLDMTFSNLMNKYNLKNK